MRVLRDKRVLLSLIFFLLFLTTILGYGLTDDVSARRGFGNACTRPTGDGLPDDTTFFPYGFYCGSDADNDFKGFTGLQGLPRTDTNPSYSHPVAAGDTLGFSLDGFSGATGYPTDRAGPNSPPRDMLVWVTVDGNDDVVKSVSGSGGTQGRCPGDGSGTYGTVYGYRDTATPGQPGQSPFGYDGGSRGRVSCGTQGKMIYWKINSGSGIFFSTNSPFQVETWRDNNPGGQVCLRQYVSVEFSRDNGRYFPSDRGAGAPYSGDENVIASHIVKRSKQWCYDVAKTPPPPPGPSGSTNAACTETLVRVFPHRPRGSSNIYEARARVTISGVTPGVSSEYVYSNGNTAMGDRTFYYTPTNNDPAGISVTVVRQYKNSSDRWVSNPDNPGGTVTTGSCYHARCTIEILSTNAPGRKATAGSTVTLRAYMQNDVNNGMELRTGLLGVHPLALEQAGGSVGMGRLAVNNPAWAPHTPTPGGTIPVGGTAILDFSVQANADATGVNASLVLQSAYVGRFNFGTQCGINIPLYQPPCIDDAATYCNGGAQAQCPTITGRAFHPEAPGMIIDVHIYVGPTYIGGATANGPGQTFSFTIPDGYMNGLDQTFTLYAIDPFGVQNGGPWNVGMVGCGKFYLDPSTQGTFAPSDEDPSTFTGTADVTAVYPGWHPSAPRPALPGTGSYRYLKNGVLIAGTARPYPHTSFINRSHPAETINIIPPLIVGDRYCLEFTISNAQTDNASIAYIQNNGVLIRSSAPLVDPGCDRIENRPFQKVYGSAVSAGGAFKTQADGSCSGGGDGFLGGWFNNVYNGTYHYGASTELSALAMVKTVGFASAQLVPSRSPTDLSFANATKSTNRYSPELGGEFGGASCLTEPVAKSNATALPSTNIGALNSGSYVATGNVTLTGGALTSGADAASTDNISIFVNGNVRINGAGITYDGTTWRYSASNPSQNNIPSFILRATGNIYIDNSVKQLDGSYVAQPRADGSEGGNIYTCASNVATYAPMPKNAMFDNCRNQLTVQGSFVADNVRLMRTYGTLRDEKPIITAETTTTETINRSELLFRYACGTKHTYSKRTSISGCNREGALGGILPTASSHEGRTSTPIYMWTDDNPSLLVGYGFAPIGNACPAGTHSVGYVHNTGNNTYLYSRNPNAEAFGYPVVDPAFCIFPGANQGGEVRTTTVPSALLPPASVPPASGCSNGGAAYRSSPRNTCAAEVFEYMPELHLSTPAVRPENGDGAKPFDAITSLPPVL